MLLAPVIAAAVLATQSPPGPAFRVRGYGYASSTLSTHSGNGESYHRVEPNLDGRTWTIGGGAGAFLTPTVGLETEFVYGGLVSAPQVFHYQWSQEYTATNRDILINELVRYRAGGTPYSRLKARLKAASDS